MTKRQFILSSIGGIGASTALAGITVDPLVQSRPQRTIDGTYYPVVPNGDFEDGSNGWVITGIKKGVLPHVTTDYGNGNGLLFSNSGMASTYVDVKPGCENQILFLVRCTHNAPIRTFYTIWLGDSEERIYAPLYTPHNLNEYENDGWGIVPFTFTPSDDHGRLFIGSDCFKIKIVYFNGRAMY